MQHTRTSFVSGQNRPRWGQKRHFGGYETGPGDLFASCAEQTALEVPGDWNLGVSHVAPHGGVKVLPLGSSDLALDRLSQLFERTRETFKTQARLAAIEMELARLQKRVGRLARRVALTVRIESLAPEPYSIRKPFSVVVRQQGVDYIASFFDANVSTSGDTPEESVLNLKDLVVAIYEDLSGRPEDQLGPGPCRQLQVLREFIAEKA